ncbi:MAG: hypothetical protein GJ676_07370 [Rhodobacteraceae bacterium]|nr:hypothetical protein [Paracoccaceae bacterium]
MTGDVSNLGSKTGVLLPQLAECMASIGCKGFNQAFLGLVRDHLGADQVMVFSYDVSARASGPSCFLSFNTHPEDNANRLAQEYLETGYAEDPLRPRITRLSGVDGTDVFTLASLNKAMTPSYKRRFFDQPGIVDKLTVLSRRDGICLGVNLYRFEASGPFKSAAATDPLLSILGQLALLHFSDRQPQDMRSPLLSLSDREREICEGILRGRTAEAIAWDLNVATSSVTTYRKRAYAKLGINSKSALFVLCGADR